MENNTIMFIHILKWFIPVIMYVFLMGAHMIYERKTGKKLKGFLIIAILVSLFTVILFI